MLYPDNHLRKKLNLRMYYQFTYEELHISAETT